MTGLGPSGNDNTALGIWLLHRTRIPYGECDGPVVQPRGANINDFVGVVDLYQCGEFTAAVEGVYECIIRISTRASRLARVGVYFSDRRELQYLMYHLFNCTLSLLSFIVNHASLII